MRHDQDAALDQCLTWLRDGMSVSSCLDRYPEYAADLRPVLELAVDVVWVRVPAAPIAVRAAGQRRMLAALAQKKERRDRIYPIFRFASRMIWSILPGRPGSLRPAWRLAAVMLAVVSLASGWMTIAASADSLPGDALYPVKLVSQRVQLALTFSPARHRLMTDRFEAQQRLDIQAVLRGERQVAVEFRGILQQMEKDSWVVGGLPVALRETTTIIGLPYLGAVVQVKADLPGNGELAARWLRIVSKMAPEPTDVAQPTGTPDATSTPEAVDTQEPTRTLEPTTTAGATKTPILSGPPESTETLVPKEAPEQEETPDDTEVREPDERPEQEEALDDTETPGPDDTPEQDEAPDDTETPEPDETPEQEETPDDTETPEPDDTPEHKETQGATETAEPDRPPEHEETPDPTGEPDD